MLVQESSVAITMPWFWESVGKARPTFPQMLEAASEQVTKSMKSGFDKLSVLMEVLQCPKP
jgi:hypothetical protein